MNKTTQNLFHPIEEVVLNAAKSKHANINAQGSSGITPIHNAAIDGRIKVMSALINAGADVNITDHVNDSPLHSASANGMTDAVKLLIVAGSEVNARNSQGQTPLHFARTPEVASILLKNGADANVIDHEWKTPLHHVEFRFNPLLRYANLKMQNILLDAGANPFVRDKKGNMPKGEACEERRKVITQQKHLEAHLSQVPTPSQVSGSVGQGDGIEMPKRRRL